MVVAFTALLGLRLVWHRGCPDGMEEGVVKAMRPYLQVALKYV